MSYDCVRRSTKSICIGMRRQSKKQAISAKLLASSLLLRFCCSFLTFLFSLRLFKAHWAKKDNPIILLMQSQSRLKKSKRGSRTYNWPSTTKRARKEVYHNDTRTRRDLYAAFQTQGNTLYHSWRSRTGSSRVCNLRNRSSVIENVASVASFLCYWKYLRHRKRRLCSLVSMLLKISAFSLRSIGLPNSKGEPSKSANRSTLGKLFMWRLRRPFEAGRKLDGIWMSSTTLRKTSNRAIYSWNSEGFNPKVILLNKKAPRVNSLQVGVLMQKKKKYAHSKKTENEEVLFDNFFLYPWFSNSFFWRFKIQFWYFIFTPKPSRIRKCVEPPHFSQRTLGNLKFEKEGRNGVPSPRFLKFKIEIETVVMTSRSQELAHLKKITKNNILVNISFASNLYRQRYKA